MADLASAKNKINDVEVRNDAPQSESLNERMGASINYLIDTTDDHETRVTTNEGDIATLQAAQKLQLAVGAAAQNNGTSGTLYASPAAIVCAIITTAAHSGAGETVILNSSHTTGTLTVSGGATVSYSFSGNNLNYSVTGASTTVYYQVWYYTT